MDDDGLFLPDIRSHSLVEKIRRHNYYASMFARAMSGKFAHVPYIGLYSGAGRARVLPSGDIVETSAMSVLKQEVPFSKYIFVDADSRCIAALDARISGIERRVDVTLINKPVNDAVPDIMAALPSRARAIKEGLLALCFVDPFRIDLDFDVIRQLSTFWIDFMVMLPLGFDYRRNLRHYLDNEGDDRVARLIDAPDWRSEWRARGEPRWKSMRFVARKFDEAMARLGYNTPGMRDTIDVKVPGMGVYLYSLAFYSRHDRGKEFWKATLAGTDPQIELDF